MNTRLRQVRKELNYNQKDFADKLLLSQGTLAQIEKGARSVTDRTVKLLCSEFNVKEEWLRTGNGEMFNSPQNKVQVLAKELNLTKIELEIIENTATLKDYQQKIILDLIKSLQKNESTIYNKGAI